MIRHFRALKALLDVVGEEMWDSGDEDAALRQRIGELAQMLREKIDTIERGEDR